MALVRVPAESQSIENVDEIRTFLAARGIDYEFVPPPSTAVDTSAASADALLALYAGAIDALKARGGYTTADVIDVTATTPGLDAMLTRFNAEHWHDEDEVRLIIEGRGLFHIHPLAGPVFVIEVQPNDLIRVPKGTHHWFDLCGERRIRAIRLFQNPSGWTPQYTASGVDRDFQPLCFGPVYFPAPAADGAIGAIGAIAPRSEQA
jgi:1,2-dihydroxy-3-keto-5-methylthiopentene dioxygenase